MSASLRTLALGWMAWASVARVGQDGLRFVGRLVLARLLWPEAFGLFALAFAVSLAFSLTFHLQLHAALIQRRELTPGLRATAYWSLGALGVAAGLALLALSGPLSALVGAPAVAPLLVVMSLHHALDGFTIVPRALVVRGLGFRRLAGVDLTAETVATAAAVSAALAGAGPYSLVIHLLALDVVELALFWRLVDWRPARHWRRAEFLELARFGGPLMGKHALDYVVLQGDRLLVGLLFGPAVLGLYALALRLVKGMADAVSGVFEGVAFPAFARTRADLARSQRGFLDALRAQAVLTFPLLAGLALTAPDLVPLALGAGWAGAVPFIQVVAVRALAGSLLSLPRAVLLAHGTSWLVFVQSLCGFVLFGAGWLVGARWGALGVAAGGAIAALLLVPVGLALMRSRLPVSLAAWVAALAPAAVGAACLGGAVAAAASLLPPATPPLARLAVLVAAGSLGYVLPLVPWLSREARHYLALWRARPSPAAAALGERVP